MCSVPDKCSCLRKIKDEFDILRAKVQKELSEGKDLIQDSKMYRAGLIVGLGQAKDLVTSAIKDESDVLWRKAFK